jgi:pimeloyl-ACP methyl ester carboxylesterase
MLMNLTKQMIYVMLAMLVAQTLFAEGFMDEVEHGYADNDGVRIHYATVGEGPVVVMIHGFPDFWYSWHHQMAGLQDNFQVVAIDQRGYNLSDQPEGVENYDMSLLVSDVVAVVRSLGREQVTIVGHDWGGAVAWNIAFTHPEMVSNLIILNLPHVNGLVRTWASNEAALAGTNYARVFREGSPTDPDIFFGMPMTPQTLAGWVTDDEVRQRYIEAFEKSDFTAMLNYYKQNYPDLWSGDGSDAALAPTTVPQLGMPTLVFHGLEDQALHSDALNNTWDWIDADLTLVTVPGAGHFVQQDAAQLVTTTMRWWLLARQ